MSLLATRVQLFHEILRELDTLRTRKEADARRKREVVYMEFPRLEAIDMEMALLGTKTARAVLSGNQNIDEIIIGLKDAQKKLETEKKEIFQKNYISPKEFEVQYSCVECKDTGFIETQRCICLKHRLMDKLYDQSNVRDIIRAENFECFNLNLYSSVKVASENSSPKDNMVKAFRRSLTFVEEFNKGENILMYGSTGLGKTFLCNCIAGALLEKGHTVLYLTAGQLFRKLEEQRFQKNDEAEAEEWDKELLEAELLIIDDLGTEFATIFTASELFRIVNDRKLAGKSIIISTNLTPNRLTDHYSDRVTSRLMGEFETMKFFGEDIRILKRFGKK